MTQPKILHSELFILHRLFSINFYREMNNILMIINSKIQTPSNVLETYLGMGYPFQFPTILLFFLHIL